MTNNRRKVVTSLGAIGGWLGFANLAPGAVQFDPTALRDSKAESEIITILHALHGAFERRDIEYIANAISSIVRFEAASRMPLALARARSAISRHRSALLVFGIAP